MNNQNLIVYQLTHLFKIFKELEEELNFSVIETIDKKSLINDNDSLDNYLIITKKKFQNCYSINNIINYQLKFLK